ncbi:MAG: hypothetical protein NVS9B3_10680 [Gemmatimonadaceae bacterium]
MSAVRAGDLALRVVRATIVTVAAAGCGAAGGAVIPTPLPPAAIRVTGGDAQRGVVGSVLAPIIVRVEDANGRGVRLVPVVFRVVRGTGNIDSAAVSTDSVGLAHARWP